MGILGVIEEGRGAVITGAASGIGLAVAKALVARGMRVVMADLNADQLAAAVSDVRSSAGTETDDVAIAMPTDVSDFAAVERLKNEAVAALGDIALVHNNAGIGARATSYEHIEGWKQVLDVNLWGVVHGVHAFVPYLLEQGQPACVINTGSKQGITNPPGNAAYNVSKAGVRFLTESLAHDLRTQGQTQISAHLLVPGFTYTGMIQRFVKEKPPAAWTPDQVADYLLERLAAGDFYILCPDNDVSVALDHKRLDWNTQDVIQNRPALSRWHPDFESEFNKFVE